jgi:hypothetical protein
MLWPIEYLSVSKDIYVSNDGVHLVVAFLPWEVGNCSDRGNALEFYANGQPLSVFNEDRLLVGYLGRRLLSLYAGVPHPTCTNAKLDDGAATFEITTNWGDAFRFDIATGKLVESTTSWSIKASLLLVLLLIALSGLWMWRRIVHVRHASRGSEARSS